MPPYPVEPEQSGTRRSLTLAVVFLLAAVSVTYLPDVAQQRLAFGLRASVLRPFIGMQQRLADARLRAAQVEVLRAQLDSLAGILSTQSSLSDENRTLRSLLGLARRIGPRYVPASVLRPGTAGSESMFLLLLGARDGVEEGAPVINRHGLVGVVREVRERTAVGMDWTHPDFRASAMTADGAAYGMVENRRGDFREADRLILAGGAYHEQLAPGTLVVTSGLGRRFPRGIPIGRIDGVAEVEAQWLKNYWLRPMVLPGEVTHVLVALPPDSLGDLSAALPPDSARSRLEELDAEARTQVRLQALEDSVLVLRARLEEAMAARPGGGP
ncbi:MAG: rod shape-determining protein MreC [Longimicrobiales bacterium]